MKLDRRVDLGGKGARFFERVLREKDSPFPFPSEPGTVQTWLPDYLEEDRIYAFDSGHLNLLHEDGDYYEAYHPEELVDAEKVEELDQGAYRIICEYLSEAPEHRLLLQTRLSKGSAQKKGFRWVQIRSQAFLEYSGADFASAPHVSAAFDRLDGLLEHSEGLGFLYPHPPKKRKRLCPDFALALAYGGEAWLVWSRNALASPGAEP